MASLIGIEREMAAAYVQVHAPLIKANMNNGHLMRALGEARGVVEALERLTGKGTA